MVISQEVVRGRHLLADGDPADARIVPDGLQASQPRLSLQHRRACLALAADPWVVSTMTQGYRLQFWRRPRVARSQIFTTVANQLQAQTLRMELSTLLEKGGDQGGCELRLPSGVLLSVFPLQSLTPAVGPREHQEGADYGVSDSPPDRIYRRIPSRLGSRTQRSGYQRTLEGPLGVSAYQLVGAEGGLSSPKALSAAAQGSACHSPTDNTVTAAYINRQGGLGSPTLCKLATALWLWAHP